MLRCDDTTANDGYDEACKIAAMTALNLGVLGFFIEYCRVQCGIVLPRFLG